MTRDVSFRRELTVFGALVSLAGAVLCGYLLFAVFSILGCAGYDYGAVPCENPAESYCDGWVPPSDVGEWLQVGAFQAASLGAMLFLLGFALAFVRKLKAGDLGIRKTEAALIGAAWAIGVAVTAVIDLGVYIDQWIEWAHFRFDEFGEPFAYPTTEVRTGALVAGAVVVLTATLAFVLLRWRRGQASQAPSAPET